MNIGTSKSKGVDAYNATLNSSRPVNNLNPTISEGGNVWVRIVEVQVGRPDPFLTSGEKTRGLFLSFN